MLQSRPLFFSYPFFSFHVSDTPRLPECTVGMFVCMRVSGIKRRHPTRSGMLTCVNVTALARTLLNIYHPIVVLLLFSIPESFHL